MCHVKLKEIQCNRFSVLLSLGQDTYHVSCETNRNTVQQTSSLLTLGQDT